jgi:hypothetical protein
MQGIMGERVMRYVIVENGSIVAEGYYEGATDYITYSSITRFPRVGTGRRKGLWI